MGYVLVDDYSKEPLDKDHPGIVLSLGSESWSLHLSDKSKDALYKALEPFTEDAEPITRTPARAASKGVGKGQSNIDTYGFDTGEVRKWAQTNKVKQPNGKPVGDRGRIPQEVYDAFKAANK